MTNTAIKPTTGKLIQELPGGRTRVLEQNKPFPVLQKLKKEYIQHGYSKDSLKVTY